MINDKETNPDFPSLEEIKKLPPDEAIKILDVLITIDTDNEEAYLIRGMKYWSMNVYGKAVNDYHVALRINPSGKARALLDYANEVLNYYNKDLLNP